MTLKRSAKIKTKNQNLINSVNQKFICIGRSVNTQINYFLEMPLKELNQRKKRMDLFPRVSITRVYGYAGQILALPTDARDF